MLVAVAVANLELLERVQAAQAVVVMARPLVLVLLEQ
jgi:hypothetical protein